MNKMIAIAAEEQGFCAVAGLLFGRKRRVVIERLKELIDSAYPTVAGSPAVEVVLVYPLLTVHRHDEVAVARSGYDTAILEDIGKAVGHAGVGASDSISAELAEIADDRIEAVEI